MFISFSGSISSNITGRSPVMSRIYFRFVDVGLPFLWAVTDLTAAAV